jgi:hypothetical protein
MGFGHNNDIKFMGAKGLRIPIPKKELLGF